jgi:hypothetical protein
MTNNADSARAKDLSGRTGMKYTDALAYVTMTRNPPAIRHRWLISEDLRAWLNGDTWRGCYYENLYDLMNRLRPRFECDWCYEDANAAGEDCTVEFVVTSYDPDIHPRTEHITNRKYHARCKAASAVIWANPVGEHEVPEPYTLALAASAAPSKKGRFRIDVMPHLSQDPQRPPVLFLTTTVLKDSGQGAAPWINEMEMWLRRQGFTPGSDLPFEEPPPWTLRVVPGEGPSYDEQWIGLRSSALRPGVVPTHFYLGAMGLTDKTKGARPSQATFARDWTARAAERGYVMAAVGPLPVGNTVPWCDLTAFDSEELDDLVDGAGEMGDELHEFLSRTVRVADPADPSSLLPIRERGGVR